MRHVVLRLIGTLLSLLIAALTLPLTAEAQTAAPACNATSFAQIPDNISYFVGRRLTSGTCAGTDYTLALWLMNTNHELQYIGDLLSLPISVDGNTVTSVYDPTVFQWSGEDWVAFECAGSGPALTGPSASCIAPLVSSAYIDTSRMSIAVSGRPQSAGQDGYSASVPKVFAFNGTPYMYWTVVHFINGANGSIIKDLTVRGSALSLDGAPSPRFWLSGSVGSSGSSVGAGTVEVLSPISGDATLDGAADGFDVRPYNGRLLMTVGVGGVGCVTPLSRTYGCYRMQIRSSTAPLGIDSFNSSAVTSANLPFNPHEYSRFFVDANGGLNILGAFFSSTLNDSSAPSQIISTPFAQFPVDPSTFQYGNPSYTPQPSPAHPGLYLNESYSSPIQQFFPSCSSSSPYPNPGSGDCRAGVARFCVSQGFGAAGVLQESASDNNTIGCLTTAHATRQQIDASNLSAINPSCNNASLGSGDCASAISGYCRAQGYAGGFGPTEHAGTALLITCADTAIAQDVFTTFTALSQQVPDCTQGSWPTSIACGAAASRICRSQGFVASWGVHDYAADNVVIGCWRVSAS